MKVLAITAHSASFELEGNSAPYFSPQEFDVYLNGAFARRERRNVFSVFGLQPQTEYAVEACGESARFVSGRESALFNVCDFKTDGTDDTEAFSAAISCLPENSTLYVPAGTYYLRPLFLKSNMTLWLDSGATLIAHPDRSAYPVLPALIGGDNLGTWQGEEADCFASLITAYNQTGIRIIGEGVIDCNALAGDWYENHRVKRGAWRPRGIFLNRCKDVLLQGVTVKNTPSWNIHPYFCRNVEIYDVTLENIPDMPTTDGIDPDCCDGVEIAGVKISVGDDCIAIKSGTLEFAKKYGAPCKNITVRNCIMREGHGGVVLGSELSGGIENVTVNRCLFEGTDRGLRIKTRRGRGRTGKCDGITFSDIEMRGVKVPFVVNMYYNMGDENGHTEYVWTTEKLPVDERTPEIGAFAFENMRCYGAEYCAGAFYGLPEAPIGGVSFKNVSFTFSENARAGYPDMKEKNEKVCRGGLYFLNVKNVCLENVTVEGADGKPVILDGVENFSEK